MISNRQFKRGAELLLDALSTFTASELLHYNEFVSLTVIAGALTLGRVDLKKKVCDYSTHSGIYTESDIQLISSPEVNQTLPELPVLGDLVKNLYECHYDKFFRALGKLISSYLEITF